MVYVLAIRHEPSIKSRKYNRLQHTNREIGVDCAAPLPPCPPSTLTMFDALIILTSNSPPRLAKCCTQSPIACMSECFCACVSVFNAGQVKPESALPGSHQVKEGRKNRSFTFIWPSNNEAGCKLLSTYTVHTRLSVQVGTHSVRGV